MRISSRYTPDHQENDPHLRGHVADARVLLASAISALDHKGERRIGDVRRLLRLIDGAFEKTQDTGRA